MAHDTGCAGSSGQGRGLVMLWTGPEQHSAKRGALEMPNGGVLQIYPEMPPGHSDGAPGSTARLNVGLPAHICLSMMLS